MPSRGISSATGWWNDNGVGFRVSIDGLYDYDAGIAALTDGEIIGALRDERPLVMGNRSHAMVLTAVAFAQIPGYPPQVYNFGVADPFPGAGIHGGSAPDLVPMCRGGNLRYLCLPRVVAL